MTTLEKGLSFIPTRKTLPLSNILDTRNKLIRSIKLKYHFRNKTNDNWNPNVNRFTERKNWVPADQLMSKEILNTIDNIKLKTAEIIDKYKINHINQNIHLDEEPNLSGTEVDCLKNMKNNTNIIIKPADKGGATVILNKQNYIQEAERQLSNTKYYKALPRPIFHDNIPKIKKVLNDLCDKKFITKEQYNYLSGPVDCKNRTFYLLPKIHKKPEKWPQPNCMPEGRPIVSDVDSETYRISEYIDSFINPLTTNHFSYLKNSYEFISKIKNQKIEKDYLLVTGDVSALYTNMDIDRTITCVRDIFNKNKNPKRPDNEILKLLEISLKNNDFEFNGKYYLQILGTAMGKRFAPSLANLYLLEFDEKAANGFPIKPLLFFRYLDDIFFIWPGDVDSLKEFEKYLNNLIPNITITLEYSKTEIPFLDTFIYIQDNTLQSKTYFKPTDTHQLLHTDSFHPRHTFRGLLKSQLVRFKRLSSTKADYDNTCKLLFSFLLKRGYTHSKMRKMQGEIWFKYADKQNTITKSTKNDTILPIVVDFCKLGTELAKQYKLILGESNFFSNFKPIIAYKTGNNFKKILTRSKLENISKGAFRCCGSKKCLTCRFHATDNTKFKSEVTKKHYEFQNNMYCKSKNIIYLITCRQCKKQYVGETGRELRERVNDHRSAIKNKKDTPIAVHFNLINHSILDLQIVPIEIISNTAKSLACRRIREAHWQLNLKTTFPFGINCDSSTF